MQEVLKVKIDPARNRAFKFGSSEQYTAEVERFEDVTCVKAVDEPMMGRLAIEPSAVFTLGLERVVDRVLRQAAPIP
jgi:hypothetical protein